MIIKDIKPKITFKFILNKVNNQENVNIKRIPIKNLKFSIHSPDFGKNFIKLGKVNIKKQGNAKPIAILKKIIIIIRFEANKEKPTAVPKKGALHGVAKRVANSPDKKLVWKLFFELFVFIKFKNLPGKMISKKPKRLSAKTRIIRDKKIKK